MPLDWIIQGINLFLKYMFTGAISAGEGSREVPGMFTCDYAYFPLNTDTPSWGHLEYNSLGGEDEQFTATFNNDAYCRLVWGGSDTSITIYPLLYYNAPYLQVTADSPDAPFDFYFTRSNKHDLVDKFCIYLNSSLYVNLDADSVRTWRADTRVPSGTVAGAPMYNAHLVTNLPSFSPSNSALGNAFKEQINKPDGYVYVPFPEGSSITYEDAYKTIESFAEAYPELEIDMDDILTFDEINPSETEPTEPTSEGGNCCGGFDIDYDELVSPSELYDVLNTETYDLAEIDTSMPDLNAELPSDVLANTQITMLSDALTVSYNFWDALGLSSTLIALGVLAALFNFIKGG